MKDPQEEWFRGASGMEPASTIMKVGLMALLYDICMNGVEIGRRRRGSPLASLTTLARSVFKRQWNIQGTIGRGCNARIADG
jgi:hypothetical protein